MKVINVGDTYKIYSDNLKVSDTLEPKCYIVGFDPMQGFYLGEHSEIKIKEDKIYGIHNKKVNKVLNSFKIFERNLGVILSGNKGIGKSLFATLLSVEASKIGLPTIIVDTYYPGIANYIDSIHQECIILFDEFDKTFGNIKPANGEQDAQASMLSLFDGLSNGKKLFVITCNEIRSLNDYLVNRTGRFHYHFRFEYPTIEEIEEYLKDKLDPKYYSEIGGVVAFSRKVDLNFDSLRAIAFELNLGGAFKDIIKDLNIVNMNEDIYILSLHFNDGKVLKSEKMHLNLFGDDDENIWVTDINDDYIAQVIFNVSNCVYDFTNGTNIIRPDNFTVKYHDDSDNEDIINELKRIGTSYVTISKCNSKSIHYAL